MSQIAITVRLVTSICAVLLVVSGCGTPNEKSPFDPDAQKHAADWIYAGHAGAARAQVTGCTECHGEDLMGGISKVSCSECHLNGPTPMTGCTSCHGNPPNGNVVPNRGGVHSLHYAFVNVSEKCGTCHSGAGSMTVNHYNGLIDVTMPSLYNAKSGAAVRNSDGTCSNVRCHGGQRTPVWLSGSTIDVNTQCVACHAYGTGEDNSFISGRHNTHVNVYRFACTKCHDATLLQAEHFTTLNTSAVEGDAAKTINSSFTYGGGLCSPMCHNTRPW